MKLQKLRDMILDCEYVLEVHENDFKCMTKYIRINDIITLHDIHHIDIIGADKTDDVDEITVWFNNHYINLGDIESLRIREVRSCL